MLQYKYVRIRSISRMLTLDFILDIETKNLIMSSKGTNSEGNSYRSGSQAGSNANASSYAYSNANSSYCEFTKSITVFFSH